MARVREGIGAAWSTVNDAAVGQGHCLLSADPAHFDGVRAIGVDEHVWRRTRRGEKHGTIIIDLTVP